MGLFDIGRDDEEKITIEHPDDLTQDTKVLLINAIALLETVETEWHKKGVRIDMTCRMQLRSDCREMEQAIRAVDSRMCNKKKIDKLINMYLRLSAEAEAVLKFEAPPLPELSFDDLD